jgi:hypothetical protein
VRGDIASPSSERSVSESLHGAVLDQERKASGSSGILESADVAGRIYEEPNELDASENRKPETVEMHAESGSSTDVLADMDAFQREIDELRKRYSRGEG